MDNAARALISWEFLVAPVWVATKKLTASERYCSEFVRFGAVYCTNLARSPKETRQAADEPTLEPSFDPLVNMAHEAAKEDWDLEGLGPISAGMAERIKRESSNKT
jgi:hypothetical protein